MKRDRMSRWIGFAIGFLTFLAAHAIEVAMWTPWFGGAHNPWFLNSGRSIVLTMSCLFVASLIAGGFRIEGRMITAGATTAMTIVLVWIGGSTIFPIVVMGGCLFLAFCSLMGAFTGREIARAIRGKA